MSTKRKQFASEAVALAQYHAINQLEGLPRLPAIQVGLRAPLADDPSVSQRGWSMQACEIVDGPGPTAAVVMTEEVAARVHGQSHDGVTVNLSGRVDHTDPESWPARMPIIPPGWTP